MNDGTLNPLFYTDAAESFSCICLIVYSYAARFTLFICRFFVYFCSVDASNWVFFLPFSFSLLLLLLSLSPSLFLYTSLTLFALFPKLSKHHSNRIENDKQRCGCANYSHCTQCHLDLFFTLFVSKHTVYFIDITFSYSFFPLLFFRFIVSLL